MLAIASVVVGLFFAVLAVTRERAGAALGIVISSTLLWPEAWRVPLGLMQMSVPRIVALILLTQFLATGRNYRISFGRVDGLVVLIWIWTVLATVLVGAEFSQVSEMIGRGFDTVLMYFIARLALLQLKDLIALVPGLVVTAVVMGMIGVFESFTATSPYHDMLAARLQGGTPWRGDYEMSRLGLLRARGSTTISIFFGLAMVLILGFLWSVRDYISGQSRRRIAILSALLAALSSMSSGPWVACFLFISLQIYGQRTHWIKPSLQVGLLAVIFLEIASNRHFYELVDYLALDSQTAWYRTRLLEVAVSQWRDYWLVGVGSNWPHHWAAMVDGRKYIDVVNHYVIIVLYGGIPAVLMYVSSHVIALQGIVLAWRKATDKSHQKLFFGLGSTLIALDFASMSVGLFGPPLLLGYLLLGAIVSTSGWSNESVNDNASQQFNLNKSQSQTVLEGHRYID